MRKNTALHSLFCFVLFVSHVVLRCRVFGFCRCLNSSSKNGWDINLAAAQLSNFAWSLRLSPFVVRLQYVFRGSRESRLCTVAIAPVRARPPASKVKYQPDPSLGSKSRCLSLMTPKFKTYQIHTFHVCVHDYMSLLYSLTCICLKGHQTEQNGDVTQRR